MSDLLERLYAKREITDDGCWLWQGARRGDDGGTGFINIDNHMKSVHRVAYEELVGAIPEGMQLVPTCNYSHCFNPAHRVLMTPQERGIRLRDMRSDDTTQMKQDAFLAWLALPRGMREPGTMNELAVSLGVSAQTLINWKARHSLQERANAVAWTALQDYLPDVLAAIGQKASEGSIKHINLYLALMGRANAVAASQISTSVHLHPEFHNPDALAAGPAVTRALMYGPVQGDEEESA